MTYTSHTLGGLEPDLVKKLARLTIQNPGSMMREGLLDKERTVEYAPYSHTVSVSNDSKIRICWIDGQPVAWAFVIYATIRHKYNGKTTKKREADPKLMIYVKKRYRGQGIGSKLLDWSRRVTPNQTIMVFAHDKGAKALYKNCSSTKFIVST